MELVDAAPQLCVVSYSAKFKWTQKWPLWQAASLPLGRLTAEQQEGRAGRG